MVRKVVGSLVALSVVVPVLFMVGGKASATGTTFTLNLSQNQAFALLGYDCGGISEKSYTTGFDPTSGYPTGDVYLSTTCSGSGRGGHSTTHTVWAGVTWDFTAVVVADAVLAGAPTVDPAFTAYDANQNEVYNVGGGNERTNLDITERILEYTGASRGLIRYVADRPGHDRRYALATAKLRGLGWEPAVDFGDGLAATVAWYREHRSWWEPIKSGEYRAFYEAQYGDRTAVDR